MIMDLVYLGAVVAFFALTWGLMKMCEVLQKDNSGGHS
ncbi:MAG: potassium ABC transporter ATPase [Bacteroidota bacterium]|jgi:hypothetical protein